jgi:small-conductance mechanosensitive channel
LTTVTDNKGARLRDRDELVAIVAGAVALAALVCGRVYGNVESRAVDPRVVVWGCAGVMVIAGAIATRRLASFLGRVVTLRARPSAGGVVRLLVTCGGYLILLFAVLATLGVSLSHLLVGVGIAGVVLGIAAQQSLGNIFAALVLVLARPFAVGERIRIRSGFVGVLDVTVLELGLTYVTVQTEDGRLKIPNSAMLAAAIGEGVTPPEPDPPALASPSARD